MLSRLIWIGLALTGLIYVLADSRALEFTSQTRQRTETVERVVYMPVFRWERLLDYLHIKKVSKVNIQRGEI